MPSPGRVLHSIMDRLLQLLPDEPRALKLLDDIVDADSRSDAALIERGLHAPEGAAAPGPTHEVPASVVRSSRPAAVKHRAAS